MIGCMTHKPSPQFLKLFPNSPEALAYAKEKAKQVEPDQPKSGSATGSMKSSEPNVQNVPKPKKPGKLKTGAPGGGLTPYTSEQAAEAAEALAKELGAGGLTVGGKSIKHPTSLKVEVDITKPGEMEAAVDQFIQKIQGDKVVVDVTKEGNPEVLATVGVVQVPSASPDEIGLSKFLNKPIDEVMEEVAQGNAQVVAKASVTPSKLRKVVMDLAGEPAHPDHLSELQEYAPNHKLCHSNSVDHPSSKWRIRIMVDEQGRYTGVTHRG